MRVLLTGAAGRQGSVTYRELLDSGHEVVATDVVGHRRLAGLPPIRYRNLLDATVCYELLEGCDAVIHLANHPNLGARFPDQTLYSENVTINGNVFAAACDLGVNRVVFASSIQACHGRIFVQFRGGEPVEPCPSGLPYLPIDGRLPANPSNLYGSSKVASERLLVDLTLVHPELSAVALRFPALTGERTVERIREYGSPRWLRHMMAGECMSYLDQGDAARLMRLLIEEPLPGYRCYLPAAPDNLSGMSAREAIERVYPDVPLKRPIEQIESLVDISEIVEHTGWRPLATSIAEAMAEYLAAKA